MEWAAILHTVTLERVSASSIDLKVRCSTTLAGGDGNATAYCLVAIHFEWDFKVVSVAGTTITTSKGLLVPSLSVHQPTRHQWLFGLVALPKGMEPPKLRATRPPECVSDPLRLSYLRYVHRHQGTIWSTIPSTCTLPGPGSRYRVRILWGYATRSTYLGTGQP